MEKRTAGAATSAPVPHTYFAALVGASVSAAALSCESPNRPERSRMTGGGRHHTVVAHDSRTSALTNAPKWRSRSLSALRVVLWRRRAKGLAGEELAEWKAEWGGAGAGRTVGGLWALSSRTPPTAFFVRTSVSFPPGWYRQPCHTRLNCSAVSAGSLLDTRLRIHV